MRAAVAPNRSIPVTDLTFDAVLWDMDGTLIDSEPLHEWSYRAGLGELGIEPPADLHDAILGRSEEACHAFLVERLRITLPLAAWKDLRYRIYLENTARAKPFAQPAALWAALAGLGVPQAVVSNSDRLIVDANMRGMGIDPDAYVSVSRDDVPSGKPAPDPYRKAAEILGVKPSRAVAVEDTETGIASALAAGVAIVTVTPELVGAHGARPFADLEAALARLRAA